MVLGLVVGKLSFALQILLMGAVPGHGEQAQTGNWIEKPKVITNCSHLSIDGRNHEKPSKAHFFLSSSIALH